MSITTNLEKSDIAPSPTRTYPQGSTRFNWMAVGLSTWVSVGYFLARWASFHGRSDYDSPVSWAAPAYAGVLTFSLLLLLTQWRNRAKGYAWRWALPQGYGLSLAGVGLALIGVVLDPLWLRLLPPANGVAVSLVLPALAVAIGLMLVVAGPFRAARARLDPSQAHGWAVLGPLVLSMTLVLSLLTNLTLFASPIFEPYYGPYGGKTVKLGQEKFSDLYLMNSDGTEQTRLTASSGLYTWSSDWSPDGKQIVFTRGEPDNPESALYIIRTFAFRAGVRA